MALTLGELRKAIEQDGLGWQAIPEGRGSRKLATYGLGGSREGLPAASKAAAVDFRQELDVGMNPALAIRRLERGFVDTRALQARFPRSALLRLGLPESARLIEPPAAATATAVDWRNRWGRNWVTSVRDQDGCNACWAFAGVALVEAMVRIEDSTWVTLSEGDVHGGIGAKCADLGNLGNVSAFFDSKGIADPGCFPWSTKDRKYAPTADRNGRSVRGPAFGWVGSVKDAKDWLDTVGPLITWFDVYSDFFGYSSGVYQRSKAPSNTHQGGHFMLVVGYSEALGAWLVKNSWGTGWGMSGYGWIKYGDSGIDKYAKASLRNTNVDPWSKRRLHNGALYESGNGPLNRNLEVMGANGKRVLHRWRDGGPPWKWSSASSFAKDAAVCPTLTGTTFDRNMELVYLTTNKRLHHWWGHGGGTGPWHDGGVFGPNDCQGVPGFIQGDYNAPGNFEVVVRVGGGRLQHLWRDGAGWHAGPKFGSDIAYSGPSLIQGDFGSPHGNLEVVAVRTDGTMQHFWRDESTLKWHPGAVFGAGLSSPPAMIQGQYGMNDETGPHGNFELCVAKSGSIQHWWRHNAGDLQWRHSATFGHHVLAVAGLCQSQWSMNLEVIALRTDKKLQHYWRDGAGWHEGPVLGSA